MADTRNPVQPMADDVGGDTENLRLKIRELEVELADARRSSQQYLQNVAHQLTAPLGAIKWSIEGLKEREVSVARKLKLLSSIYSQATILVHLIKNFALMSNLEADHELGQFRERPEAEDVFRLCLNLADDFRPQAEDMNKKILVDESSFRDALQDKDVLMVKNLIAQALSNLLENAVKYADELSTIVIRAERAPSGHKTGDALIVSVVSIGLPVSQEETQKLFERGFRGTTARQKVPAGTGIGLYLAKRIMTLHQGAIGVQSKGKQATFRLIFPPSRIV